MKMTSGIRYVALAVVLSFVVVVPAEAGPKDKPPKDGPYTKKENGKLRVEGSYSDGKRDGLWTYYYYSGAVERTVRYEDGKKTGAEKVWLDGGQLMSSTEYRKGVRHGAYLAQTWGARDGRVVLIQKTTGRYYEGKKHGVWADPRDGKVYKMKYDHGKTVHGKID